MSESDIMAAITALDKEMKNFQAQMAFHRKKMLDNETELIAIKLKKAELEEELRVHRNRQGII